uniref:KRAB domain-containing protein n=1 Tax=Coturnix japonica TaxID=93934 RepID=A0A8C2Y8X2_COTJA
PAPRPDPALCPQVPVTFKDVFVDFSRDEWALLDDEQKELHRSVMQSNCELLLHVASEFIRHGESDVGRKG